MVNKIDTIPASMEPTQSAGMQSAPYTWVCYTYGRQHHPHYCYIVVVVVMPESGKQNNADSVPHSWSQWWWEQLELMTWKLF